MTLPYLDVMSEFVTPTKRNAGHIVRDILGVVVGAVCPFPILVTRGHAMFGQMGVSEGSFSGSRSDPAA